jgi:hypothetical protein
LTNWKRRKNINTFKEEEIFTLKLLCMGAFFASPQKFKYLIVINDSFEAISLKELIIISNLKLKIKALPSKVCQH